MSRDPSPVAILAARLQRAYPALSPYSAASLAEDLTRIERAQRRHAERCCSGADGGYVRPRKVNLGKGSLVTMLDENGPVMEHDPIAEERAHAGIVASCTRWENRLVALHDRGPTNLIAGTDRVPAIEREGDPRGPVLKIRLPGETEATSV